mmetsp:Transcript_54445/g.128472  ORF Transcript_54445/g.128472 Transcript_54445/m.128472 type:complete len:229 (-) Transcript_54445:1003-1689(-)
MLPRSNSRAGTLYLAPLSSTPRARPSFLNLEATLVLSVCSSSDQPPALALTCSASLGTRHLLVVLVLGLCRLVLLLCSILSRLSTLEAALLAALLQRQLVLQPLHRHLGLVLEVLRVLLVVLELLDALPLCLGLSPQRVRLAVVLLGCLLQQLRLEEVELGLAGVLRGLHTQRVLHLASALEGEAGLCELSALGACDLAVVGGGGDEALGGRQRLLRRLHLPGSDGAE